MFALEKEEWKTGKGVSPRRPFIEAVKDNKSNKTKLATFHFIAEKEALGDTIKQVCTYIDHPLFLPNLLFNLIMS